MKYYITGGEFNNKGAEAMTLVALYNIYRNDKDAVIYMNKGIGLPPFKLSKPINYIYLPLCQVYKLIGKHFTGYGCAKLKDFIKFFIPGYDSSFASKNRIETILSSIDIVIDVSGYAFCSKWPEEDNLIWLDYLTCLQKYIKRIYLMPQSFGPIDFESQSIVLYAKKVFTKCTKIFVREESGYKCLQEMGLNNIELCDDSVLIDNNYTPRELIDGFNSYLESYNIESSHNIAIVPNYRIVDTAQKKLDELIDFYSEIIESYMEQYCFWLIPHAREDLIICEKIKEKFAYKNRVKLVDHVLLSFNYEELVEKMDFIIASRYHSIIHAYKKNVPAVILGWADKYVSLAQNMDQSQYLIDYSKHDEAFAKVKRMANNYNSESDIIKTRLELLQKQSCYSFLQMNNLL